MMGFSTAKLIAMGVGALAVISFVLLAFHWRSEMIERGQWRDEVTVATRGASANPKLAQSQVALQIRLLGKDIAQCKGALGRQNEAIGKLAADTKAAQDMAAKASAKAAERVDLIDGVVGRLNASARSTEPRDACKPSGALTEAWR